MSHTITGTTIGTVDYGRTVQGTNVPSHLTREGFDPAELITDVVARRIGADWHGGQTSALCAFATTGTTRDRDDEEPCASILSEIDGEISSADTIGAERVRAELWALRAYVVATGPRGRVSGWSRLSY